MVIFDLMAAIRRPQPRSWNRCIHTIVYVYLILTARICMLGLNVWESVNTRYAICPSTCKCHGRTCTITKTYFAPSPHPQVRARVGGNHGLADFSIVQTAAECDQTYIVIARLMYLEWWTTCAVRNIHNGILICVWVYLERGAEFFLRYWAYHVSFDVI